MAHNPTSDLPAANSLPIPTTNAAINPAQQAFREAVQQVEGLRQRLRDLQAEQADARRRYWQQVGPAARAVVEARQTLFAPLENALLLHFFSRAEEEQITGVIVGNARALQERFGEDASDMLLKYAPQRRSAQARSGTSDAAEANASFDSSLPPHEQAAEQARARRKTKAQKAREVAEKAAREEEQQLLSNTKTLYRQLARTHHPDLERNPDAQQHKTALMQRITEAYEANDLYTLLQLLSESAPTDHADDDVLTRYTQALQQQQIELKQQLNELKYGPSNVLSGSGKKQEAELRQLKRYLRAEAEYVQHVSRLIQEPVGLREVLRELAAEGQETV
ncbi:hypothetical protein SAMN00120144_1102 [Hymenobacter roseosalivarius DSM 11622]|uniref:Heat shock protein DnaJ domain protein n=1 Tax=Hymenobacter roseosalivarius DSM 11622 TaxID=645990 RepID=A0A1W1VYJ0_9BACT|nr:J domain-containing protein [Hymenobacter roseosalivarius]SMB98427.1 hypothetical protein SAMN00120144_1102 [Hymenobacter roseosalivarius DSM 11622]